MPDSFEVFDGAKVSCTRFGDKMVSKVEVVGVILSVNLYLLSVHPMSLPICGHVLCCAPFTGGGYMDSSTHVAGSLYQRIATTRDNTCLRRH